MKSFLYSIVVIAIARNINHAAAETCASHNSLEDRPYWTEVASCTPCTATVGCGYCLSTLACVEGDESGPSDGSPCPEWISKSSACPSTPTCELHESCDTCASDDECAWCASESACMTISSIFEHDCRGTVFDAPCPQSFVATNNVMGNVIVEADPVFGGGEFTASGLHIGSSGVKVESPSGVVISAGDQSYHNESGGDAIVRAGDGLSKNRGRGGNVQMEAGRSNGSGIGGGAATLRGGSAKSGAGGDVLLSAGDSVGGLGGSVTLKSGSSVGNGSGDVSVSSAAGEGYPSGKVEILTGQAATATSGEVSIETANA